MHPTLRCCGPTIGCRKAGKDRSRRMPTYATLETLPWSAIVAAADAHFAPLAQWSEQRPHKPEVDGSIPSGGTTL